MESPLYRKYINRAFGVDFNSQIDPIKNYSPSDSLKSESLNSDEKKEKTPFDVSVLFSFDTTGSMSPVIDSVRKNLNETVRRLFKDIPNIGIGCISHGDYCDRNIIYKLEPTKNVSHIEDFIMTSPNTGGGDAAECYEYILDIATSIDWNSEIKVLVMIGDEVPHEKGYSMPASLKGFQSYLHLDWKQLVEACKLKQITIFSCHALADKNQHSLPFYHHISKETGGYYFELNELQSFPYFMVTICMKAADSADNLKLLREKQSELSDKLKENNDKLDMIKSIERKIEENNERLTQEETDFINLNSNKKIKISSDRSESIEALRNACSNINSNISQSSLEYNELDFIQRETKSKGFFNNSSFTSKSTEIRKEKGLSTRVQSIEKEFTSSFKSKEGKSVQKLFQTISTEEENVLTPSFKELINSEIKN
jgi:hypothetical protein